MDFDLFFEILLRWIGIMEKVWCSIPFGIPHHTFCVTHIADNCHSKESMLDYVFVKRQGR